MHIAYSSVTALLHGGHPPPPPLHACLAINAWCLALCTVVLPLCMLYTLERRARRRFRAEAARTAQEAAQSADASLSLSTLERARLAADAEVAFNHVATFPLTGLWLLDVWLYSHGCWVLAVTALSPPAA